MSKCIVWERLDGGVSVSTIDYTDPKWAGMTEAAIIAKCLITGQAGMDHDFGPGAISHVFEHDDLPPERLDNSDSLEGLYRNAWEWVGGTVVTNMPKARGIHMNRIRKDRDAELEKESGSKFRQPPEIEALFTAARLAKLQALRDIPQTLDLNTANDTPAELKAVWPVELPK